MVVMLAPFALSLLGTGLQAVYVWFINVVFERLIVLGLFSWIAGLILGERARKVISDLWHAVFRLLISGLLAIPRAFFRRRFHYRHDEDAPHQ